MADWIAAIAAVAASVFAALALAVALRAKEIAETANGIANDGNALAETANGTASDALAVAEQANGLSADANSIADRALRATLDDVSYNWVLEVNSPGVAKVHNDCGHPALHVTITLDSNGTVVTMSEPIDLAPFGAITLDVEGAFSEHIAKVHKNPSVKASGGSGVFIAGHDGKPVSTSFRAHVAWQTEQGLPRTAVASTVVRHHMSLRGLRRLGDPMG